jgi:manganese/zinc/iron transport system substrate-binding protein
MKSLILSICIGIVLIGCRLDEGTSSEIGPIHIVTTTGIIEDVVTEIVGDSADVSAIMGPGTDPHIYKPAPSDIELLEEADVIIANGLHLEGKMAEMLEKYSKEKPVLIVADGISEEDIIKSADFDDAHDPHIWFDTRIWMDGMRYITSELGKIDTNASEYYMENFTVYEERIAEMDEWIFEEISSLDSTSRTLITSHDAFSYFGRRYKIEVKGIQGISTLSEVGLKDVAEMVDFVIENEINSIFVETSTSDKTAQSIVDGAKDKGYELKLNGPLYSDALGEPDSEGGTYIGMIKENVRIIVEGLK